MAMKKWLLPVAWNAGFDDQPAIAATATTPPAPTEIHYHVHLPAGTTPAEWAAALPQPSVVEVTAATEREAQSTSPK